MCSSCEIKNKKIILHNTSFPFTGEFKVVPINLAYLFSKYLSVIYKKSGAEGGRHFNYSDYAKIHANKQYKLLEITYNETM